MSATLVLPDAERAVRAWGRSLAIPQLGRNWHLGVPKENRSYPMVIVVRVGGAPDSYIDVDNAQLQIDVRSSESNQPQAYSIAARIVAAIQAAEGPTPMGGAVCGGARVLTGPIPRHDDDRQIARYLVTAAFSFLGTPT